MSHTTFPPLPMAEWRPTRDTLHGYCRVLGAIRRALAPPQKHWWHVSLRAAAPGLTTTPIPAGDMTFDILLDLISHQLSISTSAGDWWEVGLRGQPQATFFDEVLHALHTLGVEIELDRTPFAQDQRQDYDAIAVEDYWQALSQIDQLLKQFRGELREECSPVQLWPHHFDLSLVWFSGRTVPGADPANAGEADEQMAFGFATGDETVDDAYFYITAYPLPDGLLDGSLPAGARWHTDGWKGALLPYAVLTDVEQPRELLLDFWRTVQRAGANCMG